jgi:hypothetical protein
MLLYRQRTSQRTWLLHHSGPKKPHRAGPMGLTDGAIIFAGSIIGLLCTLSHEAFSPVHKNTAWHRTGARHNAGYELPRISVLRLYEKWL